METSIAKSKINLTRIPTGEADQLDFDNHKRGIETWDFHVTNPASAKIKDF